MMKFEFGDTGRLTNDTIQEGYTHGMLVVVSNPNDKVWDKVRSDLSECQRQWEVEGYLYKRELEKDIWEFGKLFAHIIDQRNCIAIHLLPMWTCDICSIRKFWRIRLLGRTEGP